MNYKNPTDTLEIMLVFSDIVTYRVYIIRNKHVFHPFSFQNFQRLTQQANTQPGDVLQYERYINNNKKIHK